MKTKLEIEYLVEKIVRAVDAKMRGIKRVTPDAYHQGFIDGARKMANLVQK